MYQWLLAISLVWSGTELFAAELRRPALPGQLVFTEAPGRFQLEGPIGQRLNANLEQWLLRAPQANPGLLQMFQQRDREPGPQVVPWAGEFVGKYLISAIQATRLTSDPRLTRQVETVLNEFIATQAEDGYLGPFPKKDRLLKNWDLWGHYHAIQALLLWHEQTGDQPSLQSARRAGDLVCRTYLNTGRRVLQAGDPEMNMAILTAMAMLYRHTGEARYLSMAREVEKDWEQAGDYLRAGLDGVEFFQSPKPRWESLHDLQGLLELWRITGEARYRRAFEHHWRSIRRWDRRNTGGFSSGEQATGNPYAPSAIETCCTVAWMVLTLDYLKLTGSAAAADEFEFSFLNGGLGSQHPSGRWWTYSTPMDGVREASAHSIVFQARAGTPELNCCSVNGPRVLGMLSEWALMSGPAGALVVNWLGQGSFNSERRGQTVVLRSSEDAWRGGRTTLHFLQPPGGRTELKVRIPGWARQPKVRLNGRLLADVQPGSYLSMHRKWSKNDRLEFQFNPGWKVVPGAHEAAGKVSLYYGPLLLAYDQQVNEFDEQRLPRLDLDRLNAAARIKIGSGSWLLAEVPGADGEIIRLLDFASAGQRGTRYRTWLAPVSSPPPPAVTQLPRDGESVPAGPVRFQWRRSPVGRPLSTSQVEFSMQENFGEILLRTNVNGHRLWLDTSRLAGGGKPIWWRVHSLHGSQRTESDVPPAFFVVDSSKPPAAYPPDPVLGPGGEVIKDALRNNREPEFGRRGNVRWEESTQEGTRFNGRDQMVVYPVVEWPAENYSVHLRFKIEQLPAGRIAQLFSGWTAGSDDPLRLVIDGGKLFARIEAGAGYSTPGVAISPGHWHQVAVVKRGDRLVLFLDGREVGGTGVPFQISTRSQACAIAGNPRYSGPEFLAVTVSDFVFYAEAVPPAAQP